MTPVRVLPEAEEQIRRASEWWQENRPAARGLFDEELQRAVTLLETTPLAGRLIRHRQVKALRRLLMAATRYHLYYDFVGGEVRVLSVWSAVRGRRPKLPMP